MMTRLLESALRRGYESGAAFKALESYGAAPIPSIVGTLTTQSGVAATSGTVNKPTGTAIGETLVIVAQGQHGGGNAVTWTPPSGFLIKAQYDALQLARPNLVIMTRVVDGSEGSSFTFSWSSADAGGPWTAGACFRVNAVVNVVTGTGGDKGSGTTGNLQDVVVPNNTLSFGFVAGWSSTINPSPPGGWADQGTCGDPSSKVFTKLQVTGTSVPDTSFSWASSEQWSSLTVGLTTSALVSYGTAFAGAGEIRSNTGNDFTHDVYTLVFAAYVTSATFQRTMVSFNNGTNSNPRLAFDSGNIAIEHETGDFPVWFSSFTPATYYLGAITKGTGAVAPKLYLMSNGSTWTYDGVPADAGTAPNPSASISDIWLGCTLSSSFWNGEIAAIALANTEASAATIHGLTDFNNWSLLANLRFFTGTTLKSAGTMNDTGSGNNDETSRTGVSAGVQPVPSWLTNF